MAIPCPYVYANSKSCPGRIIRVEAYKADVEWEESEDGKWVLTWDPRSHYHLFCSVKGDHVGPRRRHDPRLKFFRDDLPDKIRALLDNTEVTFIP